MNKLKQNRNSLKCYKNKRVVYNKKLYKVKRFKTEL